MMFNKNNRNKKISIMFMLVFMLNILIGILPQDFFAYANNQTVTEAIYGSRDEPTVSESVYFIREIKLTDTEGNPLPEPVSKDSELRITYYFEIPNTMDLKEDEDFTITVPEEIQKINKDFLNHPLNDQDGNTIAYANFYVDNTVKVVFTDYVEQQGLGDIKGKFWVERRFESSKIGNEGETNIVFDLNGESTCEIKVEFETVPEETKVNISKTNSYSAKDNEITWTIEVEPGSSPTSNLPIEDVIITDLIENNQEYVSGSFNMDANIDGWDKDNEVIVTEPSGENRELKITFKYTINTNSNEVYTIKFKTKPDITAFTSEGESISFNNRANVKYKDIESGDVKEQEDTSTRQIKSDFISKVGKHNRETKKIEWIVTINNNYFNIPAGAKIEDIIPDGLTLDKNSIKLDNNPISIGGPLTYDDVEKKLNYTFAAELNEPHKFTYITDVTDPDAYKSNTAKVYTNTATFIGTGIPGDASVGIGVRADTEVISKMGLNHYPSSHEIEWAIVINRNKIEIENPVVTDIIPDGLKYVEDSFTVNGIKTTDGLSYDKGNNTFIYDFTGKETDNKINDIYTLRFRTKVLDNKVYAVNGSKAFTNEVTLKGDNIPETTDTASKTYRSKVIEKTGIDYCYVDRIVTWEILVNQNNMGMNNAYIEDVVPDGQAFVEDSVTINGDVVPEDGSKGSYTYNKNSKLLKYEFPTTINTKQIITFKTKITNLSIFETNGPINIENTVKLYGDDIPDNVESKGTQEINRVVVSKTGEYEKGDSFIEWNVIVNKNQLEIDNPILEDTLQEGLSLDTATVQLFELNIDSDGSHTKGNEVELTRDNIEYNNNTRLFKFHFEKTITNAYLLKFQTDIASTHKNATFSNSISFQGSHGDETGDSKKITVEVQEVGGGASGRNGSLTLTKVDKDNHEVKLENAKFQLFNRFGDAMGDIKSTDQAGIVVFDKLKFGIPYIIKEIEAPEGYVVDENAEYKFTLSSEEKDIAYSMKNEMVKGNIEFKKIDKDTKDPIKGAIFELFEESNTDIPIAEDTSSAQGTVSFKDVAYGRYVIKEKTPAEGYLKTSVMLKANILENGETVYAQPEGSSSEALYELENSSIKGKLKIIKTDGKNTSKKLQNAEFKIFKVTDSGELYVDTIETNKDGVAQIDDLVYGEYILREVKAPEGYYINNKDYNVTITDNGMTVELQVENKKIPVGTLVINKLDAWSGEGLVGVEFGIYNKDDDLIKKFITDEKGIANVDNLETGIYTVKEMDIPEGYHELYVEETVEIKTDEGTTVTIENHPLRTLVIKKIDKRNTDKALSGAVFEVKNEEGKIIGEIVTNDDGLAKIEGLVFGEYTIKETKAPNRYRLDSTDFTVNIDKQTPVIYEIQRENAKKRNSGGGGSKDPDPDPKPDSEPGPEPDPEPDVDPELDPNPDPEEPVIEEDTSVDGELDVPEDSNPELGTPPENGKVTIDEKGKWTYTPNPGFVGKDKSTIKIKYPDGTEEEKFIEIDVEDIPLGRAPGAGDETLPQTGEQNHSTMYLIGAFLIALGIELKRRNINKSKM